MKISQTVMGHTRIFWEKLSKGHNFKTKKGETIILVCNTSSLPKTHSYIARSEQSSHTPGGSHQRL